MLLGQMASGRVRVVSPCAKAGSVGVPSSHGGRRITLDVPEIQRNKMRSEAIRICLVIMLTAYKVNIKANIIESIQQQQNEPE